MASISVTSSLTGPGYLIEVLIDDLTKTMLIDALAEVPKLVAQKIVEDHFKEIMDAISINEVTTLIAAAVAQKVADAYKPKEQPKEEPDVISQ